MKREKITPKIKQHVETILRQAGWLPTRRIELEDYLRDMLATGTPVAPRVIAFLREFGELDIPFEMKGWKEPDLIRFSLYVPETDWQSVLEWWGEKIGHTLYNVGYHKLGDANILMDENARIYTFADRFLWKLGDSAMDGITAMIMWWDPMENYHDTER